MPEELAAPIAKEAKEIEAKGLDLSELRLTKRKTGELEPDEARIFELRFPAGGLVRRSGYPLQPAATTFDCLNVWPFETWDVRDRGGSRPGTEKAFEFNDEIGSDFVTDGQPIQLLDSLTVIAPDATLRDVLVVVAAGKVFYSYVDVANEMITDGGFEDYTGTQDDDATDAWDNWTQVGAAAVKFEATATRVSGSSALKMTRFDAGTAYFRNAEYSDLLAVGTEHFRLTYWTKGDGTNDGRIKVQARKTNTNIILEDTGVTGTTWVKKTHFFSQVPGNFYFWLFCYPSDVNPSTVYFDDVSVVRVYETEEVLGAELVEDGVFAGYTGTADDDTTDVFDHWSTGNLGSGRIEATEIDGHYVSYPTAVMSVKTVTNADLVYIYIAVADQIAATTDQHFKLVFWTKGDGTNAGSYRVRSVAPAVDIFPAVSTGVTSTTWTKITRYFTQNTGSTSLYVQFYGSAVNPSTVWYDSVSIKEVFQLNDSAKTLQSATHHQELYFADYRPTRVYSASGSIGSNNNRLTDSGSNPDWSTLDINLVRDVIVLTDVAADTSEDDVYDILSVAAGYITIDAPEWLTSGSCTYELGRGIKVFDPSDNTLSAITVDTGIAPINCPLICVYRDRLVAAQGNTWYMSRMADTADWDYNYDPVDPARPVAGSNTDAGVVGQAITALVPYADDFLVFGCVDQIWIMRGDPAAGGQLDAISRNIGILSANAWCSLPDGSIVFLHRTGLYGFSPRADNLSFPQPISRQVLPDDLLTTNVVDNAVSMRYDGEHQGVHIFITPHSGLPGSHWFLDMNTKGLFPVALPATQQPRVLHAYAGDSTVPQTVLMGCQDGFVRQYDRTVTTDDGTAISSYVKIGPIKLAPPNKAGVVTELAGVLAEDSADVTWSLMAGDTAEEAVDSDTYDTGTIGVSSGVVTLTNGTFPSWAASANVMISGVAYSVDVRTDDTHVTLNDDTLDEGSGAAYTLTYVLSTGTWVAGRNIRSSPRVRGSAASIMLSTTNRWAMESIHGVVQPGGRVR